MVVKLFGPQALAAGKREVVVEVAVERGEPTCADLRDALAAVEPGLKASLAASRFAVNQAFARELDPVRAGDEVALIGPVSGG